MGLIKVELEVEKEFLSLQRMVLFMKELGKMITCGVMVDSSPRISITKAKLEMGLLTESEHSKTAKKSIQDSGDVIKDMEMGNKFTKTNAIDTKASSQMTNIMGEGYYKIKSIHILVIS